MKYLVCINQAHRKIISDMGVDLKAIQKIHLKFYFNYWNAMIRGDIQGEKKCYWVRKVTPTLIMEEDDFFAVKLRFTGEGYYVAIDESSKDGKYILHSCRQFEKFLATYPQGRLNQMDAMRDMIVDKMVLI
jgi:hypothetical protein